MFIPRCPNCSFALVLLEKRLKYKCSKCGKLFLKREVEDRSFRVWNEKQRELDKHNLALEQKQKKLKKEVLNERKIMKVFRLIFKEKKLRKKLSPEERAKRRTLCKKKWIAKNKQHHNAWLKSYLGRIKEKDKLKKRLGYWRRRQSKLAQQKLRIGSYSNEFEVSEDSFPTFGLSELLNVRLLLYKWRDCHGYC